MGRGTNDPRSVLLAKGRALSVSNSEISKVLSKTGDISQFYPILNKLSDDQLIDSDIRKAAYDYFLEAEYKKIRAGLPNWIKRNLYEDFKTLFLDSVRMDKPIFFQSLIPEDEKSIVISKNLDAYFDDALRRSTDEDLHIILKLKPEFYEYAEDLRRSGNDYKKTLAYSVAHAIEDSYFHREVSDYNWVLNRCFEDGAPETKGLRGSSYCDVFRARLILPEPLTPEELREAVGDCRRESLRDIILWQALFIAGGDFHKDWDRQVGVPDFISISGFKEPLKKSGASKETLADLSRADSWNEDRKLRFLQAFSRRLSGEVFTKSKKASFHNAFEKAFRHA